MKGKSLTKLSVALILALGALQANAYVHESTGMNTQVDGIPGNRTKFVGANFINNGGDEHAQEVIDMYGDHTAGQFEADHVGNINFVVNTSAPNLDEAYIYGGGLVYGNHGQSNDQNSATVTGDINLSMKNLGQASQIDTKDINIYGGGGVETYTGNASVTGNVTITVANVYTQEMEIQGGGRTDGDPKSDVYDPALADVSGKVTINVENSNFGIGGAIYGSGDAWGETSSASVGSVAINVNNTVFDSVLEEGDDAVNIIMGGGIAMNRATADVNGDVSINLNNVSVGYVMGGGSTVNDADNEELNDQPRYYGTSASVKGNVNISLTDSTVDTIIGGGNTGGSLWGDDELYAPAEGSGYGTADVEGNVTVTLAGNTTVKDIYLAGSGPDANVNGDATLVLQDSTVKVTGNIHGYDQAPQGDILGTSKILFGSNYKGSFDTTFQGIDVLEASEGAEVNLTLDNSKASDAIMFSGNGIFNAEITRTAELTINAKVNASKLQLEAGEGVKVLIMGENGVLTTSTDQIFTEALNAQGTNKDAGELNETGTHIDFAAGTIAFNDAFYNSFYSNDVAKLITTGTKIIFNGELVNVEGDMTLEEIADNANTIHSNIDVTVPSDTIDKSFGASSIKVDESVSNVEIAADKTVTLVGGDNKELIAFEGDASNKSVTVSGTLQLGAEGSTNNTGKLSAPVTVNKDATFNVNAGTFEIADLTVESATLTVNNAQATVGSLKLNGTTTATIAGSMEVTNLTGSDGSTVNVGNSDTRGDLVLGEASKLNGMAFFLDPAWKDGMEVTDASRLVFKNASVDAKIAAGQNSFVVFGSGDMTNFTPVFGKQVTWGDSGVLAAAYVAQPITIAANGGLVVDGDMTTYTAPTDGAVKFAKNSVLVADVTSLKEGQALITANSFDVDKASKTVVVGDMKNGATYQLTDGTGTLWTADNIVSGNALWGLSAKDDGSFTVKLEDANKIYGNLMQGGNLANAGMQSDGAAYDYVNSLLTDASGNISALASTVARFDAAMNVGGALSIFTNAYDRSSELREIVRAESSMDQQPRLWAHVMGGKTKLKGISSGAQDIHTETDHYGLVIGAEGTIDNKFSLGVALAAGSGDTDNDKVNAKDEFDYYGISVYGRTSVGVVDILGDVSATFLKSDMKMHGVADIDTDTDTAVYSAGVQAQKTFDLGWADVTPFVGMDIYHVKSDGYSAGHGIKVEDADATAVEFPIGAKIAKSFETAGGMTVAPTFSLAVVPTVADRDIDSKVKFAGASSKYNFTFADDVQVRSELGVQAAKDNFRFGLNAGYDWGNEERSDLSVQARLKYLF